MFPHFADERERGQAVLCFCRILEHLQPSKTAATKEENEVAQPVAGARLSARLRRSRRHLFSTLGYPKALRHYLICRRGTLACKAGAYSHLCRWSGHAFKYGLYAVCRAGDELLEGLRCARSGGCRDRDRAIGYTLTGGNRAYGGRLIWCRKVLRVIHHQRGVRHRVHI